MTTISALEILKRFKDHQADFSDLGDCTVTGDLYLYGCPYTKTQIHFGKLKFTGTVRLCYSEFTKVNCGSATFKDFNCEGAFEIFDCGSATFGTFNCERADFINFDCGSATFGTFN